MTDLQRLVKNHHKGREELIKRERERSIHHINHPLTQLEKNAIQHFAELREQEHQSLWTDPTDPSIWMGMPFPSAKPIIERSQLFSHIKEMPKGAILHCHLDATNRPERLLALALEHNPRLCVSTNASLAKEPTATVHFTTVEADHPALSKTWSGVSIHDSDYQDGGLVPIRFARSTFSPSSSLVEHFNLPVATSSSEHLFDLFIVSLLVIKPASISWSPTQVWDHFGSTFVVSRGLLGFDLVWEAYIKEVFELCAKDSVPYLECRINFLDPFISSSYGPPIPHRDWVALFSQSLSAAKASSTPQHPFWGARIIYSTIRFIEPGEGEGRLRWYLRDCLALKKEFPDLIAGFDLVGWEDGLKPLSEYMEDLIWFQEVLQKDLEPDLRVPFLFHAGETLGDGSKADMNLYDAILLDTKRIGHGFSLPQHPLLMEICKEKRIAVECCPISNELLRYTGSGMTHPLANLLNSNIPVSISCHDPQVFGNPGLSYDFFQVFTASEQMNILGLGKLARQSIEFSMMPPKEKDERLKEYDEQFKAFLRKSVGQ